MLSECRLDGNGDVSRLRSVFKDASSRLEAAPSLSRDQPHSTAFLSLYAEELRDSVTGTTTFEDFDPAQAELFLREDKRAFVEGLSEKTEIIVFQKTKEPCSLGRLDLKMIVGSFLF
jgi:hypothetical protein